MYGYISAKWGHTQERHYQMKRGLQDQDHSIHQTSYTWAMKLITFLWCQAKSLWKLRNQELHDPLGEEAIDQH